MSWEQTKTEFDCFASTYELLMGADKSRAPLDEFYLAALEQTRPRTILNSACGPGWAAIALSKAGYQVTASDISSEMVELARRNAAEQGAAIRFVVSAWDGLPAVTGMQFDLVMCQGNAIGHCPGEASMVESLQALRAVTRDGGHLCLDTRSWEWFRSECAPYWPGRLRTDSRGRHTIIHAARIPRSWNKPHVIETIDICEHDGTMDVRAFPTTFYAFKFKQLVQRVKQASFSVIRTDYQEGVAQYRLLARATPHS